MATPSTEPWIQKEQLTPWDLRLWGPTEPTSPPHFIVTPKGRPQSSVPLWMVGAVVQAEGSFLKAGWMH